MAILQDENIEAMVRETTNTVFPGAAGMRFLIFVPAQTRTPAAQLVQQAINDGQAVRVRYYSQSSGTTDRTITPEVVYIHSNGYEYFDGYCHNDGRTKSFKVESIRRFF